MKQLFRCDYCDYTGTAEEVATHEETCIHNYNKKSCWTCKHACKHQLVNFKCQAGQEIPEGKYIENCNRYENDGKDYTKQSAAKSLFGRTGFGGLF